jgi:hypothetical protein
MLTTLSLTLALAFTRTTEPPGPCDLLSREEASQVLGQPVPAGTPSGPEPDEDTGGTRTVCVYQVGTRMLIVIRVAFATAADAREASSEEAVTDRLSEESFTVTDEPGLADKAYWAQSEGAAEIMALKGNSVLAVILGGMPQKPSTYHAQLRATLMTVLNAAH